MRSVAGIIVIAFFLTACDFKSGKSPEISFYYWKSKFSLGNTEKKALSFNSCRKLYVRFFDVVKEQSIHPVAMIDTIIPGNYEIVPVVFIKNDVFKNSAAADDEKLAENVHQLIDKIASANKISFSEVQFDCDWTESTKVNYFYFLSRFRRFPVTATIRLHQVKYKERSGVPPVSKGVLMYYNVGTIAADTSNSIYDTRIAQRYTPWLKDYPLALDIALPVFSWGIQSQNGKVKGLINKTNETDFNSDSNFTSLTGKVFRARSSFFRSGYYYQEGDEVKIESVSAELLESIARDLKASLAQSPEEIIFYDLDSLNLKRYEEKQFKKIHSLFN